MRRKTICLACALAMFGLLPAGLAHAQELVAAISVDPVAELARDRVALTVTGTVACGPFQPGGEQFDHAMANVAVSQASGRDVTSAQATLFLQSECDGTAQDFTETLNALDLAWHGGPARANASINVQDCDDFFQCETVFASMNAQIRVKGGGE